MLLGQQIEKAFGKTKVLTGVNIEIRPGRISALIGPSGAGKTTLLRALSLLDIPDSGIISIDDEIYNFPLNNNTVINKPWPRLTVVFQQYFLWPHLTLRKNIELPLLKTSKTVASVNDLIDFFEMGSFIDRYPNEVSIGQRQRVALARAFALEPKYILLDEITSALDVEQTGKVVSHLLALREKNIGILVVTHLLDFAKQLVAKNQGDIIYFLDKGKMLNSGGLELFDSPVNSRIGKFLSSIKYW